MINDKNLDDNRDSSDKIHGYQGIFKLYKEILIHTKGMVCLPTSVTIHVYITRSTRFMTKGNGEARFLWQTWKHGIWNKVWCSKPGNQGCYTTVPAFCQPIAKWVLKERQMFPILVRITFDLYEQRIWYWYSSQEKGRFLLSVLSKSIVCAIRHAEPRLKQPVGQCE